jgi:hypothetical protein
MGVVLAGTFATFRHTEALTLRPYTLAEAKLGIVPGSAVPAAPPDAPAQARRSEAPPERVARGGAPVAAVTARNDAGPRAARAVAASSVPVRPDARPHRSLEADGDRAGGGGPRRHVVLETFRT